MTHFNIALSLVSLIAMSLLGACSDTSKGCLTDLDCRSDRICVSQACIPAEDQDDPNNAGSQNNIDGPESDAGIDDPPDEEDTSEPEVQPDPEPEVDVISPFPIIEAETNALNMGEVEVGETAQRSLLLSNRGDEALVVESVVAEGPQGAGFSVEVDGLPATLGPDASLEVTVLFSPALPSPSHEGQIVIESNDEGQSPLSVAVSGTALRGELPEGCDDFIAEPLTAGTPLVFNICDADNNFANNEAPPGCTANGEEFQGRDRLFVFTLEEDAEILLDLKDADDMAAIDTVLYVRTACAEASSQVLCHDDVLCSETDVEFGCDPNDPEARQPRQSRISTELSAGTYYVIADTYTYNNFNCGSVELIFEVQ